MSAPLAFHWPVHLAQVLHTTSTAWGFVARSHAPQQLPMHAGYLAVTY